MVVVYAMASKKTMGSKESPGKYIPWQVMQLLIVYNKSHSSVILK